MHVLAKKKRLFRSIIQIFPDIIRRGIHTAFHIGYALFVFPIPEHPLIMNQSAILLFLQKTVHLLDVIARIRFVSQRPEKHRNMIFKNFKIAPHSVQHRSLPLGQRTGHIPGGLAGTHFLPGTMGFQISFRHHINPIFIT